MKKFLNFVKSHKIIISILLGLAIVIGALIYAKPYIEYYSTERITVDDLNKLDLDNYSKLMIVAHPDDETLWGGSLLLSDDYVVVCLTNGQNKIRSAEFMEVMKQTGDIGIILEYPDKIHGKRSDWSFCEDDILKDLKTIIEYKDWTQIVTHNKKGEYGHAHHIMTHSFVEKVCEATNYTGSLKYFGKYYSSMELLKLMSKDELPTPISNELLAQKIELLSIYKSQCNTIKKLSHMIPYE